MQGRLSTKISIVLPVIILFLISGISFSNHLEQSDESETLWYKKPAKNWNEALPLGNGRLGVMVFGNTDRERIQLNEDSLWPGKEAWDEPDGNKEDLEHIRQLLFEGKNSEVDKLFVEKFSRKTVVRSHQTMGDLFINLGHNNITDYRRELDIGTATAKVSYKSGGNLITEKIFVSHPHRAIVIEISSEAENGLNGKIFLSRPKDEKKETALTVPMDDHTLSMQGEITQYGGKFDSKPAPITNGVKFETLLKISNTGGKVKKGKDFLELKNVRKALFYIVANTSYYHDDFIKQNKTDLAEIDGKDFNLLLEDHVKDYRSLYSRLSLKLADDSNSDIPTDERLQRIKDGGIDLGLESLLFQYGRYLLISSSRVGTNPANLQGVWNEHIVAPWNADYHLNINLQMNYWLADVTNLGELNYPLFDYIDRLIENGKVTAAKNFGCRGSFLPHATDLWAPTWLRAPTAYWGCSLGAGGWMVQHYWEHYAFTGDISFLKMRAFPAIKEVAQFYSDWLIEDPRDGYLISAPSTSPENRFYNSEKEQVATCLGSAMDQQVISEVFDNYIETCSILKEDNELLQTIKEQRKKLRPGFVLGKDGRILEWDREYDEPEPGHRHMSHIYGFHPGTSITQTETPELFTAVRKTLDHRLENGGAGTGWSRAWLINCSARLMDGDMAHKHIQLLFQKSMFINLFDAHPPFQIDGNFGYAAGIAEMLLQSHEDKTLRILPALPSAWKNGHIQGIKARSGITADIFWENNKLDKIELTADYTGTYNLIYKDVTKKVDLIKGEPFTYTLD